MAPASTAPPAREVRGVAVADREPERDQQDDRA